MQKKANYLPHFVNKLSICSLHANSRNDPSLPCSLTNNYDSSKAMFSMIIHDQRSLCQIGQTSMPLAWHLSDRSFLIGQGINYSISNKGILSRTLQLVLISKITISDFKWFLIKVFSSKGIALIRDNSHLIDWKKTQRKTWN